MVVVASSVGELFPGYLENSCGGLWEVIRLHSGVFHWFANLQVVLGAVGCTQDYRGVPSFRVSKFSVSRKYFQVGSEHFSVGSCIFS